MQTATVALILSTLAPSCFPALTGTLTSKCGEWTATLEGRFGPCWGYRVRRDERRSWLVFLAGPQGHLDSASDTMRGAPLPRQAIEAARAMHSSGVCAAAWGSSDLPGLVETCNRRGVVVLMS